MSKNNQQIIVIRRDILFGKNYFQGFKDHKEINYESRILSNFETMRRGNAEKNPFFKQPIGYTILINNKLKKVLAYQRSTEDSKYSEKRLQGKWSWGFGGHIEPFDTKNENPIKESLLREVTQEELDIQGKIEKPEILGYINDDSNNVGKVHFGILYFINSNAEIIKAKDAEISKIEFKTINELEEICLDDKFEVETWSKISLKPLSIIL